MDQKGYSGDRSIRRLLYLLGIMSLSIVLVGIEKKWVDSRSEIDRISYLNWCVRKGEWWIPGL